MAIYSLGDDTPVLPPSGSCWIADSASVIGRVRLGKDVGVWFGAVIRGDNEPIEIGEGANIQDNCTLHSDYGFPLTVGAGCTVGHGAIIHGCTIGENSLIGMGATVLNGAVIGRNSIVGAGSLVTEGKVFPDNSLIVGSPAKAIRTLDGEAAARLRLSSANYIENYKRFAAGLKRLDI